MPFHEFSTGVLVDGCVETAEDPLGAEYGSGDGLADFEKFAVGQGWVERCRSMNLCDRRSCSICQAARAQAARQCEPTIKEQINPFPCEGHGILRKDGFGDR